MPKCGGKKSDELQVDTFSGCSAGIRTVLGIIGYAAKLARICIATNLYCSCSHCHQTQTPHCGYCRLLALLLSGSKRALCLQFHAHFCRLTTSPPLSQAVKLSASCLPVPDNRFGACEDTPQGRVQRGVQVEGCSLTLCAAPGFLSHRGSATVVPGAGVRAVSLALP